VYNKNKIFSQLAKNGKTGSLLRDCGFQISEFGFICHRVGAAGNSDVFDLTIYQC
jgi:hypothetical protein